MGGRELLRDIEDLTGGGKCLTTTTCFDRCEKGPNVGIKDTKTGKMKEIIEKIDDFKKAESVVKKVGAKYSGAQRAVQEVIAQYRREKNESKQKGLLQTAFQKLGDEKTAAQKE